jgi:uncharacterized protein (DUF433 family)
LITGYLCRMDPQKHRITINPRQCGGRPSIRGMRIRVTDVLDLLAAGLSFDQILEEMPDLEREDIIASIAYAKRGIDHPVIVA